MIWFWFIFTVHKLLANPIPANIHKNTKQSKNDIKCLNSSLDWFYRFCYSDSYKQLKWKEFKRSKTINNIKYFCSATTVIWLYTKIIFLWKKKCAFLSSLDILSYDDLVRRYTNQTTKKTVKINNKFMKFLYGNIVRLFTQKVRLP